MVLYHFFENSFDICWYPEKETMDYHGFFFILSTFDQGFHQIVYFIHHELIFKVPRYVGGLYSLLGDKLMGQMSKCFSLNYNKSN